MKRVVLAAVACMAIVAPQGARAAEVGVGIYNNVFAPTPAEATTGETVTWQWNCGSYGYGGGGGCVAHNVTAYSGATFASPTYTGTGNSFSYTLTSASPIRYRCTLHSTLSGAACAGMCAAIEPDTRIPSVRVFRPASPLVALGTPAAAVTFAGDVKDNRATAALWLRVIPLTGPGWNVPITCATCPAAGQFPWSASITLDPGSYTVTANARDTYGLEGRSDPITVIVV